MKNPLHVAFGLIASSGLITVADAQQSTGERLPALQTQFESRVRADAEDPFQQGLTVLNGKYSQALNQAFQDAQKAGNLDEALKVKEEGLRLTKNEPLPKEDAADLPANLKRLRTAYRQSYDVLAVRRTEGLAKLRQVYAAELQKIVAELTQQGKLEDAIAVRERIKSLGLGSVSAASVPATAPGLVPGGTATTEMSRATKDQPFVNSLGMKFVPVPDTNVLFCSHETRYADYSAYAAATPAAASTWKTMAAPAPAGGVVEAHPVVGVSFEDASGFCRWLSEKEGKVYRLPTDREWSVAVGIGKKEKPGVTPAALNGQVQGEYPWDGDYPPKSRDRAGNYADIAFKTGNAARSAMAEYDDGFASTAPVMSFKPNAFGLYDLGGNVWEWVQDWFTEMAQERTLRGAAWVNQGPALLSSTRDSRAPGDRGNNHGFRIVIESTAR